VLFSIFTDDSGEEMLLILWQKDLPLYIAAYF